MSLKGRQRAGFLGDKGQVAREAGITTARMLTALEKAVLDLSATTEEVRSQSVTSSTGTASVAVRYNSGTPDVGARPRLNFIPGTGITLTVADDSADDEVDVTTAVNTAYSFTWTGTHTFSLESKHPAGIEVGTTGVSGRFDSATNDATGLSQFLFQATNSISGTDRWRFRFNDASGNPQLVQWPSGMWELGGTSAGSTSAVIGLKGAVAKTYGFLFSPGSNTGSGESIGGVSNSVVASQFGWSITDTPSATGAWVGGDFICSTGSSVGADVSQLWGAWYRPLYSVGSNNNARTWSSVGGWKVHSMANVAMSGASGVITNWYGGYISVSCTGTNTTTTNAYGLYIEEQSKAATINNGIFLANATSGRKLIVLRDQSAYLGADAAGQINYMGGFAVSRKTITNSDSPYTVLATDHIITCNATSGAITVNLPAASGATGRIYRIKKIDTTANAVTVDGNSSETIDDSATFTLGIYDSIDIESDGTEWWVH